MATLIMQTEALPFCRLTQEAKIAELQKGSSINKFSILFCRLCEWKCCEAILVTTWPRPQLGKYFVFYPLGKITIEYDILILIATWRVAPESELGLKRNFKCYFAFLRKLLAKILRKFRNFSLFKIYYKKVERVTNQWTQR
jgi:hypothetical protein